ncbi:hypothetical protein [Pseudonocardia sp. ICBG1293]|uniref:HAAS signaling domain-containing protein n=1 Tax=Pseudonocardia sp. ICBG1293 TaxID=2844382 RepID=UPI001CCB4829|nr:hypothetical protein [Pseudonocardia sp. ICBG1293]
MTGEPTPAHEVVERYLSRLRSATADLPDAQRTELLADIRAHLAEVVPEGSDELTARRAIDALGAPEQVAAAALAESDAPSGDGVARRGAGSAQAFDIVAVLLLFLGGFVVPVIGWVVGVVMLWTSPRWETRDKWWGTLVVPGVIVLGFLSLAWSDGLGLDRSSWLVIGLLALGALAWGSWRLLTRRHEALGPGSVAGT